MDIDDDIPDQDELEWLESMAAQQQPDFNDFYPEEEEHQHPRKQESQNQLPKPLCNTPIDPFLVPDRQSNTILENLPEPDELLALQEDELGPGFFQEEEEQQQKQQKPNQQLPKKRVWSGTDRTDASHTKGAPQLDGKRSRLEPEDEEEWLRPPPPSPAEVEQVPVVVEEDEEKIISRYASEIDGDWIPVTGPDGDRVYAKINRVDKHDVPKKLSGKGYSHALISEPISLLITRMEEEDTNKALLASSESTNNLLNPETPVITEQLWVEKYSPISFTELLSDEQTNREVLLWLKQWDSCVFGSEIRETADDVLSALRRHSSVSQRKTYSDKFSFSNNRNGPMTNRPFGHFDKMNEENSNSKDIDGLLNKKSRGTGPPDHKVLLLCGPPGLGKTTLAHVAATHCGYRVMEINASDDRSASTIEGKILDVMQMNSIMTNGNLPDGKPKPKCLVIDEIDGALGEGKGAVEVIVKMVASEKTSEAGGQEEQSGKTSSKKRRKSASLLRPVICICNDLYAPALRPLRQVAKVHIFVQPTINRVVNRLKYICHKEGFRTSSIALTALAQYTECDIRSCLNTLQFLNKKKESLNAMEVSSQVVGRKDMSKSAFDVWKEVFQKRKTKQERKSINSCTTMSNDFDVLHALVSSRGEHELTMDGIHENMLRLRYHDPMMEKTVKCLNILGVSDHLHQYIMRTQQMSLYAYQPSNAVAIRSLIAQIEKPYIEWPKSFHRYRTMLMEKKELIRCWLAKISPCLSRHISTESLVEDSISLLLHILSPMTLRPVALHLQSEREKDVLAQLIDTMVSYSITYKKTKLEFLPNTPRHEAAEASMLAFDPPIDEFINFKGHICGHSGYSLAMKQILVHEVEKQKFLRESINRSMHSNIGRDMGTQVFPREGSGGELLTDMKLAKDKSDPKAWKTNTTKRLSTFGTAGSVQESVKVNNGVAKRPSSGSSNFFDRFRKSNKGSQNPDHYLQKQATMERDSRPLLFKFNEGFTNAVKRPVRIRDLLL